MNNILDAREARSKHIQVLMDENKYKTIAVLKLNVVGENKNPVKMRFMCFYFNHLMKETFQEKLIESRIIQSQDGNYIYYVINEDGNIVKERTISIEDENYLGRLVDIDVYNQTSITRSDMSCEMRKCLVCDNYAHICARTKAHTEKELFTVIDDLIETHLTDLILNEVMMQIYEELEMFPKFGLVSHKDTGCHDDMNYELFIKSTFTLKPFIRQYILYGIKGLDNPLELQLIGQKAEYEMFAVTGGINTQKGLIFALGIFLPAITKAVLNNRSKDYLQQEIIRISQVIVGNYYDNIKGNSVHSHGDNIYIHHGLKGIRGEALKGFDIIFNVNSFDNIESGVRPYEYLVQIMSSLDDTTIIHKTNIATLKRVQEEMKSVIDNGGYSKNISKVNELSDLYKSQSISPGGSSDLLVLKMIFENLKYLLNER